MGGGCEDKGYAAMLPTAQVGNLVSFEITSGRACGPGHSETNTCQGLLHARS